MYKHTRKIAVWVLCAQLLGGCAAGSWRERLGLNGVFGEDAPAAVQVDSGSLAVALEERGLTTTVIRSPEDDTVRRRPPRPPEAMLESSVAPPLSGRSAALPGVPTVSPPSAAAIPPRPRQRRRIVSIPLGVADDAHAQGLLRRTALLNGTYGGRIRLLPYGPDPEQVTGIARLAADQLRSYGVPENQIIIHRAHVASFREARIDVLFED